MVAVDRGTVERCFSRVDIWVSILVESWVITSSWRVYLLSDFDWCVVEKRRGMNVLRL